MTVVSDRFVLLGTTEYAHEKEALDFVRDGFPDRDPFHGRGLADLLEPSSGRLYEIDLLVIGYAAVFVVEIKSHPGRISGDAHGWQWTPPGASRTRDIDNPYSLTNHKAKVVSSLLARYMGGDVGKPWVQPLVFLSADNLENRLNLEGKTAVVTRDDFFKAITFGQFPGAGNRRWDRQINRPTMRAIKQAFDRMGLRPRKTLLQVGDYVLGSTIEDGQSYQDRLAHNAQFENMRHRARVYLVPDQTTVENKQRLRRAAEREVQLLWSVRDNPNILTSTYYAPDGPLGPTLVFEDFEDALRLDRFLARHPDLPFDDRVEIIRQVGHALHFCHRRNVAHGGLSPEAVLVRRRDDKIETRLFNFQLGGGEPVSATVHRTALVSRTTGAYQAPELITDPGAASAATDTFSLAALAYFVFTGQPPAADNAELHQRLHRDGCLVATAASDDLPDAVVELIRDATSVSIDDRIDDPADFVELLAIDLQPDDAAKPAESTANVLEADIGDILAEKYTVQKILGHGASARVLQVVEEIDDGKLRSSALKVSRGPDHDVRLRAEGEQLQKLRHARIVECYEILELHERTCLLLSLAGERSLQQVLAEQGSLDLDLASRYGEDLFDALKALQDEGVFHRDIKPANLGVGSRSKLAKHLTLFDFSLLASAVTDLDVGTAPYRDPFLPLRGAWDHHADRWSAAVTVHEMLTGLRPRYGRPGQSALDPQAQLHLESERFDAGLRDRLIAFFTKALAREVTDRFDSATVMARAWATCFDAHVHVQPSVAPTRPAEPGQEAAWEPTKSPGGRVQLGAVTDAQIAKIRPDTPIRALPLSVRSHNALDRAGLTKAEELLGLADNRLSAIRGIGRKVAREILELRDRWKARLEEVAVPVDPFFAEYQGEELGLDGIDLPPRAPDALADAGLRSTSVVARAPKDQVEAVLARAGVDAKAVRATLARHSTSTADVVPATLGAWLDAVFPAESKSAERGDRLRRLYGLLPPFEGRTDLVLQDAAEHEDVTRQRLQQQLAAAIKRWQGQPWRDALRTLCLGVVESLGGVAPINVAAQSLASQITDDVGASPRLRVAQFATLLRVAVELGEDDDGRLMRLRRRERRRGDERTWRVWVSTGDEARWEAIKALGDTADELAQREPLASSGETLRALEEIAGDALDRDKITSDRLVTLAAAASHAAARSSRLELYPVGMPAQRALELSAQALSAKELGDADVIARVRARYPEAEPLPPHPELDAYLDKLGLHWNETEGKYTRPDSSDASSLPTSATSLLRRGTVLPAQRGKSERSLTAQDFEDSLVGVVQDRKLRVLAVNTAYMTHAVEQLERVLGTQALEVDRALIRRMEEIHTAKGGSVEALWKADAAGPEAPRWKSLKARAEQAARQLADELFPPKQPLLLVQAGLLARYELEEFRQRLLDASLDNESAAIVLVNPAHSGARADVLNETLPVSGLLPGQSGWIPRDWIENRHRGSATAH
jgi:serine/threonine protein kinase